jgi:hypothetical protein
MYRENECVCIYFLKFALFFACFFFSISNSRVIYRRRYEILAAQQNKSIKIYTINNEMKKEIKHVLRKWVLGVYKYFCCMYIDRTN